MAACQRAGEGLADRYVGGLLGRLLGWARGLLAAPAWTPHTQVRGGAASDGSFA